MCTHNPPHGTQQLQFVFHAHKYQILSRHGFMFAQIRFREAEEIRRTDSPLRHQTRRERAFYQDQFIQGLINLQIIAPLAALDA